MGELRVLLIDDEEGYLETLTKRLTKRNLAVSGASSGEKALGVLSESPFDVVVLDVKMPGMGGIETLKEIKRNDPLVEVIMLSGHADLGDAINGMQLGAFDYLLKPVDIDELVYKIHDAYKLKSLHEQKIRHIESSRAIEG